MTTTKIHDVPRVLPYARLYLDDVEAIAKVLTDADAEMSHALPEEEDGQVIYKIGNEQMDSISDLAERAGSTDKIEIRVRRSYVTFNGFLEPSIILAFEDTLRWKVYAQIKLIFDGRQFRLKNALTTLPTWVNLSLYVILSVSSFVVPAIASHRTLNVAVVLYPMIGAFVLYILFSPSRVFFVRSQEKSRISAASREKLMLIVVTAVMEAAVWFLFRWFSSK